MKGSIKRLLLLGLAIILTLGSLTAAAFAADAVDFGDVPDSAWYYGNVEYAVERGMINGTSDTTFSPEDTITRAQFITILYRAFGQSETASPTEVFHDVPAGSYYESAVYWGQVHNVIYGTGTGTFSPDSNITRQEAAVMIGRAITNLPLDVADAETPAQAFSDAAAMADWATEAVDVTRRKGLVTGYEDGSFGPSRLMTRAEGTTMLVRLKQRAGGADSLGPTADRIHFISLSGYPSDATLVESNGQAMLVDAGNPDTAVGGNYAVADDNANGHAVAAYLRAIGVTHLDYLVMTHNHSDHIGGVPILCAEGFIDANTTVYYRAGKTTQEDDTTDWQNLDYLGKALSGLSGAGANIVCLSDANITELNLELGDFHITFRNLDEDHDGLVDFHTDDENRNSLVLTVTKGQVTTVLAADLGVMEEKTLIANGGLSNVSILKLSHHGLYTSNCYEWLRTLHPSAAVITRDQWRTDESSGIASYAYLRDQGIPVYACTSAKKATVFTVGSRSYRVSEADLSYRQTAAGPLAQTIPDGFYYWKWEYAKENNTVKIEYGQLVKNAYRSDRYGYTYYLNGDGIGTATK